MSDWLYAVLLGLIQGITEFLPVSSSGHLILFNWLVEGERLSLSLNVALHVGTLVAVLLYFWRDWLKLCSSSWRLVSKKEWTFETRVLLPGLLVGTFPAAVVGLLWKGVIQEHLHKPLPIAFSLAFVGILLWLVDRKCVQKKQLKNLSIKDALLIGFAQTCALIPGVSRSGSSIVGARLLGFSRNDSAKFSFLLGTPVMAGAAILDAKNIIAALGEPRFYLGMLSACFVGCLAIKLFFKLIDRWGFFVFALYRVSLACVIILYISLK